MKHKIADQSSDPQKSAELATGNMMTKAHTHHEKSRRPLDKWT